MKVFAITGTVFSILSLFFGAAAFFLEKEERLFEKGKKKCTAEADHTVRKGSCYELYVRLPSDGKIVLCRSGEIKPSDYPKGCSAEVFYAEMKFLGCTVTDVRLASDPCSSLPLAKKLRRVQTALIIAGCLMIFAGIELLFYFSY